MKEFIPSIARRMAEKESFCLATIVTSDGSTPRGPGTSMVIGPGARIEGTIGGGVLEAETIRASQDVLKKEKSISKHFTLDSIELNSLDMTCGGRVEVFIQFVDARSPYNIRLFREMKQNIEKNRPFHLITPIPTPEGRSSDGQWFLSIAGDGKKNPLTTEKGLDACLSDHRSYQVIESKADRFIVQAITPKDCVYIFGGGHVGLKVYEMAQFIDLRAVVIDDRSEFANPDRFPKADQVIVSGDYEAVFRKLLINRSSMIVIVTRGHRHDAEVLEKSLRTDAGYIGMIGSRKKIQGVYSGLKEKGFTEKDLARVKAPIGLPIRAETPEEIAVSIVSEIIQEKALMKHA